MARELFDLAPDFELQIDQALDCGDSVVIIGTQRGTVHGVVFDRVLATVSELASGKITRVRAFVTWDEALAAVGR